MQCLNQWNSSHGIYDGKSFTKSKLDVKYATTVKSTT